MPKDDGTLEIWVPKALRDALGDDWKSTVRARVKPLLATLTGDVEQVDDMAVLDSIIHDPTALNSDRIRAADVKSRQEKNSSTKADAEVTRILELRKMLETLPIKDRLAYLREASGMGPATPPETS